LILIEVLIGKQPMERILNFLSISQLCRSSIFIANKQVLPLSHSPICVLCLCDVTVVAEYLVISHMFRVKFHFTIKDGLQELETNGDIKDVKIEENISRFWCCYSNDNNILLVYEYTLNSS
jgi:hypothetical protein